MELTVQKFRIELNNLIEDYREKNLPCYLMCGIIAQEMLRLKDSELAQLTVYSNNSLKELNNQIEELRGKNNGESISE